MTKLSLNKETLRALEGSETSRVEGAGTLGLPTNLSSACLSRIVYCNPPTVVNPTCIRDLCI